MSAGTVKLCVACWKQLYDANVPVRWRYFKSHRLGIFCERRKVTGEPCQHQAVGAVTAPMGGTERKVIQQTLKGGTTMQRQVEDMAISEIQEKLREDGYPDGIAVAVAVKKAAATGCLVWTREHLKTTDSSRLDLLPLLRQTQ